MNESFHASERTIHRLQRVQALLNQLHPDDEPEAVITPGSPAPGRGIIAFPGSFNPPTMAHLALLKQARQFALRHPPLELYVALSTHIVDKENVERPLLVDRILLLQNVLKRHVPHTGIMLFNRGLYVEQAEAIHASFSRVDSLYFLMGFDKIVQIFDPHYYGDRDASLHNLFALAKLLVAPRGKDGVESLRKLLEQPENQPFARYIHALPLGTDYRNISSTQIRQNAASHLSETPQEVREFMRKTRAYAPPIQLADGTTIDYYGERMKALASLLHLNLEDEAN